MHLASTDLPDTLSFLFLFFLLFFFLPLFFLSFLLFFPFLAFLLFFFLPLFFLFFLLFFPPFLALFFLAFLLFFFLGSAAASLTSLEAATSSERLFSSSAEDEAKSVMNTTAP